MTKRQPAYKNIYDSIRDKIVNDAYKAGDMLPSEAEMEKMFQVSRTPVREALKQLESDGYIYRVQGKGSFVANRQPEEKRLWTLMTGFRNHYSKDWQKIWSKTISKQKRAEPHYAALLKEEQDTELICLTRIRYMDGEPVVYLEYYVRPIVPFEVFEENTTFLSIEQLLNEVNGTTFTDVEEEIEAVAAEPYIAGVLHIPIGAPLLKITRMSYAEGMEPIHVNVYYVKTETTKYFVNYKNAVSQT
ncbi:hypothetical protein SD70_22165 [Gordoniibacillus kamchatkensis]|uniref:HTH gntR-type domain-containing protein n=1 Tax=Gordoniibacillus kamchatkensis TaxID=1590651 RepID=A0ABR5ADM0_9BACL|nr:GntR family transcriptional regulator [Paenibacillus sp. VKM B-2647]KIL39135.1 hypothetical protein SD70_22165 [Paenibacillus sp. VKM B-2647]